VRASSAGRARAGLAVQADPDHRPYTRSGTTHRAHGCESSRRTRPAIRDRRTARALAARRGAIVASPSRTAHLAFRATSSRRRSPRSTTGSAYDTLRDLTGSCARPPAQRAGDAPSKGIPLGEGCCRRGKQPNRGSFAVGRRGKRHAPERRALPPGRGHDTVNIPSRIAEALTEIVTGRVDFTSAR